MPRIADKRLWSFIGRFSLIHIITYSLIASIFVAVQITSPTLNGLALEFFEPYRSLGFMVLLAELIRGAVLAFVLYPFKEYIIKNDRGSLILFGSLWGLVVLGSLYPLPGSIEGFIYTETTLAEHFMVLSSEAVRVLLFSWIFLYWECRIKGEGDCYE
ncbi:MAG: hypothetical protein ACOC5A_06125 [Halanaerobiales bacterium]